MEPINGVDVNGNDHPVVKASWESAALYCNWLSRKDSLPVFYQITNGRVLGVNPAATGYRLPTEAEWTWVARTAPNSEERFQFPWAGSYPPRGRSGNYADQAASGLLGQVLPDYTDGFPVTAPVGSFPANLRGVYDLGGNVAEWIHDYYAAAPPSNERRAGSARAAPGRDPRHSRFELGAGIRNGAAGSRTVTTARTAATTLDSGSPAMPNKSSRVATCNRRSPSSLGATAPVAQEPVQQDATRDGSKRNADADKPELTRRALPADTFRPTEEISEDFPVPFPVDI